ncbi:MAG: Ig domain-containing protein [Bacteroidales bacterium]|nr:Ig domain-containing protein [Bacteroidales bacterium]
MKKYLLLCLSAALAVFASCQQKEAEVQDIGIQSGERLATGFRAVLPPPETKTSVNMATGTITWTTDDPIMVSNGNEQMTMYVGAGGSTTAELFAEEEPLDGSSFYAVYPAEGGSYSSGTFQTRIPTVQTYARNGLASQTFPMVAHSDAKRNFAFRNAASLLRIVASSDLFAGERITSVSITANEPLSGIIMVNYPSAENAPVVDCSGGEKSVFVSCPEDGVPFGEPIYVVVAPGDYTGVSIHFSLTNGAGYVCNVDGTVSVDRSAYRTVEVSLEDKYEDLSAQETANCYMITRPGTYKFRADVKGNGVQTSCGLASATDGIAGVKVYHQDGGAFVDGDFVLIGNYICFTTVFGAIPAGTVLLSAVDSQGKTLWSWHIWANSQIADVDVSDGSVWLNMNLGAHQVGFRKDNTGYGGYYYQWGRKDPFLQKYTTDTKQETIAPFVSHASSTDGSLENSIANPHIFYGGYRFGGKADNPEIEDWNGLDGSVKYYYDWWNKDITGDGQRNVPAAKTMFDPCPPGYHVPVYADLASLLSIAKENKISSSEGRRIEAEGLYFPYTSYRYFAIRTEWWPGGSEASRVFIPSATPSVTTDSTRRYYRMYMTSSPSQNINGAQRSYGVPVRCIKDGTSVPIVIPATSLELDKTSLTLVEGADYTLTATVLPSDATDPAVSWESSDPTVATVDSGKVVAVSQGSATITASCGSLSATCSVTVKASGGSLSGGIEDMDLDEW